MGVWVCGCVCERDRQTERQRERQRETERERERGGREEGRKGKREGEGSNGAVVPCAPVIPAVPVRSPLQQRLVEIFLFLQLWKLCIIIMSRGWNDHVNAGAVSPTLIEWGAIERTTEDKLPSSDHP